MRGCKYGRQEKESKVHLTNSIGSLHTLMVKYAGMDSSPSHGPPDRPEEYPANAECDQNSHGHFAEITSRASFWYFRSTQAFWLIPMA